MAEITCEQAVTGLAELVPTLPPHEAAAVRLLLWHKTWLQREDFRRACLLPASPPLVEIHWRKAAAFLAGTPRGTSSAQVAILEIAIALAEDELHLTGFGHAHKRAVAEAFAAALGQELAPAVPRHNHPDFIPCGPPCPLAEDDLPFQNRHAELDPNADEADDD